MKSKSSKSAKKQPDTVPDTVPDNQGEQKTNPSENTSESDNSDPKSDDVLGGNDIDIEINSDDEDTPPVDDNDPNNIETGMGDTSDVDDKHGTTLKCGDAEPQARGEGPKAPSVRLGSSLHPCRSLRLLRIRRCARGWRHRLRGKMRGVRKARQSLQSLGRGCFRRSRGEGLWS